MDEKSGEQIIDMGGPGTCTSKIDVESEAKNKNEKWRT